MADDWRDIHDLPEAEEAVMRRLEELGALMREQESAEAEIDVEFVRNLRAHLEHGEQFSPHPTFARNLRVRLVRGRRSRVASKPARRQLVPLGGLIASAVATAGFILLAILVNLVHTSPSSFNPPYPTRADLVFSYPSPRVIIHRLEPTLSLVHTRPGVAFKGRLHVSAPRVPGSPARLRAYRLASPADASRLARRLGIKAHVRHVVSDGAVWSVAADGGSHSDQPLHSLAISRATGELIYHDRRNFVLPRSEQALDRDDAIHVARLWLEKLGWPGRRMPIRSVGYVATRHKVRQVVLGWVGVGPVATEDATLWITPNRSVIEAWLWPPVVESGFVSARPIRAAFGDLSAGKLPLAVKGISPYARANAGGTLQRATVVSILSPAGNRKLYLVPTYQFQGRARLSGHGGSFTWYSLAPGAKK